VRYPEFAVLSAVSARPLRAPCVEMKYWSTDRPSAEVRRDGGLDDLARRLRHQATHGRQLADLLGRASSARVRHDVNRVEGGLDRLEARLRVGDLLLAMTCIISCVTLSATPAQISTILL